LALTILVLFSYRFIPEKKRQGWTKKFTGVQPFASDIVPSLPMEGTFPFFLTVSTGEIALEDENGEWIATLKSGFMYVRPCSYISAFEVVVSFDHIGNKVFLIGNLRMRGFFHPDLPREILNLQVSVDYLRATKGFSVEAWLQSLGYKEEEEEAYQDDETSENSRGWRLPYVYIAPFSLNLVLKGFVALNDTREKSMRVDAFCGTQKTTSNNLIIYFVTFVLARTPGLLGDVKFLGMDVSDLAGTGTGMTVGAQLIPGGQYIAIAVLATVDMVNGAIAAGKESRGRPDDAFRFGDMARGTAYFLKEVTRKGAIRRGKSHHDFYDEDDRIKVDPADFVVGATEETGKYLDRNKARFAGAAVGCVATVTLSVFLSPMGGLGAGLLVGQGTTMLIIYAEKKIRGKKEKHENHAATVTTRSTMEQSIANIELRMHRGPHHRGRRGKRYHAAS
jgi:hypothetical protein